MANHCAFSLFSLSFALYVFTSCLSGTAAAEEYYAIGMAYFELGKYAEAEPWLIRARSAEKTVNASDYNLGRIAFETGWYEEAAEYFERILKKDEVNIQALKAAAYSRIKMGDLEMAELYYDRVRMIEPESADNGYNYALVLSVLGKYAAAEEMLEAYPIALRENRTALLLYARALKAQNKPEAADAYTDWLAEADSDAAIEPNVRYEYAACLESAGLFARALEEYRAAGEKLSAESENPSKAQARFAAARVLLIADSENPEGLSELEAVLMDGFADKEALAALLTEDAISEPNKAAIQNLIDNPPAPSTETRPSKEADTADESEAVSP